jgi:hypothetical protein
MKIAKKSLNGNKQAYNEAMRYVNNAVEILKNKAAKKDKFYSDKKYVRMAGNTLWNGVLEAMDYRFPEVKKRSKTRPSVYDYKEYLAKTNKKILTYFVATYEEAHLYMGYDGNLSYQIAKEAVENSKVIIEWATN